MLVCMACRLLILQGLGATSEGAFVGGATAAHRRPLAAVPATDTVPLPWLREHVIEPCKTSQLTAADPPPPNKIPPSTFQLETIQINGKPSVKFA